MKVGDAVAVLQITAFKGTIRIPAVVTAVSLSGSSFGVKSLGVAFDEDGHRELWLAACMKGQTWE